MVSPQPLSVMSVPGPASHHREDVDRHAAVVKPGRHLHHGLAGQVETVLSRWAPVSKRKPPPEMTAAGATCLACDNSSALPGHAVMVGESRPVRPERNMVTAWRICGERLPLNATTSSRPVRSRLDEGCAPRACSSPWAFQQHVQPGGHGLLRLVVVQGVA